jgi:diguanylate cyclase
VTKLAENEDWRRKYLDSLRTIERDEQEFRAQEQQLRKLVRRLCMAAQGQSSRLDAELKKLDQAIRKDAPPQTLEPLTLAITNAVHELDQGSATLNSAQSASSLQSAVAGLSGAAIVGDSRMRSVLARLLMEVRHDERLVAAADEVERAMTVVLTLEQLPEIVERTGGLIVQRIQGLEKGRQELELLLGQLLVQLDSMSRYVSGQSQDVAERSHSNQALNLQVSGELRAIGEADPGTDLGEFRRLLRVRLDSISRHLQEFQDREAERARLARERGEEMRNRVDELEGEARRLHARLLDEKRLSMLDALTQIPNRLAYEQRIAEELDRWRRFGQPTCVAAWDIDHFKRVNDSYGHRAGDKVLTVVAEWLARSIRATDFVARYGGEEFVMVLPGTTLEHAMKLANDLRQAVGQLGFHFRGTPVSVTISGGITALLPEDKSEDAFDRADKALYKAKDSGRNQVQAV